MNNTIITRWVFAGVLLGFNVPAAQADIYKFVDAAGVTHFTNVPGKSDAPYKLYMREGKSSVNTAVPRASGTSPSNSSANRERFSPMIDTAAKWYGMDHNLLHAIVMAESSYNPDAISGKGAVGLMQLMPDTAKRYRVMNINDPVENVHGGARYLRDLMKLFNNDMRLAVAAYNAGENAVIKSGYKVPPYSETVSYVARVLSCYNNLKNGTQQPQMVAQITASP